jgi:hypothetical protein
MSSLRDVLDEAMASGAPDVETSTGPDGVTTWAARGTVFAMLSADGSTASFLLDPIVAGAAARTPDVHRSERGPGWVEMHRSCRGPGGRMVPVRPSPAHRSGRLGPTVRYTTCARVT